MIQKLYYLFLFISVACFSQLYEANTIPTDLKKDARAVIRSSTTLIEFNAVNQLKTSREVVMTVLDKSGDKFASAYAHYNPNTKIDLAEASLYDSNGKLIKKFKSKDFLDVSAVSSGQMYTDDRVKYLEFTPISYPYTLHYKISVLSKNTLFIPQWFPLYSEHLAIEKASFQLVNKTTAKIRSKEYNFKGYPIIKEGTDDNFIYRIENIEAVIGEEIMPQWNKVFPYVVLASNNISYDGVNGTFDDWKSYGKWSYDHLVSNRLDLTPQQKNSYQSMVSNAQSEKEKVQILYKHLQQKVRYIGVQLGIGGFSPFPASYVESKSYGDCKALSNYMVAMLDAVGIKSYHTVLHAGEREDISKDIMYQQGNHMIVYVPLKDEEVWLEATSQDTAFNYLGNFGSNRDVLIYDETGGRVIPSQQLHLNENTIKVTGEASISVDGQLNFTFSEKVTGLLYDHVYPYETYSTKDLDTALKRRFSHLHGVNIVKKEFINNWKEALFTMNFQLNVPSYAKKQENMILFDLIPVSKEKTSVKKVKSRMYDFVIKDAYIDEVSYFLTLPNEYKKISIEPINEKNEFGNYHLSVESIKDNTYKITRVYQQYEGNFPKEKFNDYVDFRRKIAGYDNSKIIIELN